MRDLLRTRTLALTLVSVFHLAGCGEPPPNPSLPVSGPLHGGVLVPLTNDEAVVEVLNGERRRSGSGVTQTVIAYVLQPDRKTPVSAAPSQVTVSLDGKAIPLSLEPDQADPSGGARFVSNAGPYELNQRGGEVSVALEGKTLTGSFRGPR
jgi:hypothetical protein